MRERDRDYPLTHLNINGGRVPILQIGDEILLMESNAILFTISRGTSLGGTSLLEQSKELQWLFFEQNSHEPNIARLRLWRLNNMIPTIPRDVIQHRHELGEYALSVMQRHLTESEFFLGQQYGIADISLFAYTHAASEAGFDLNGFPSIQRWLDSVRLQPGHISIEE
jgi:glutathione S-transferase